MKLAIFYLMNNINRDILLVEVINDWIGADLK